MDLKLKKILIVNGLNRSGLSVASALKQAGEFKLHFVSTQRSLSGTVKRIINSHLIDSAEIINGDYSDIYFADRLIEISNRKNTDVIIPIGNAAIFISKIKHRLQKFCMVLVEDYEKLLCFHDKSQTLRIATELDIPHPTTYLPESINEVKTLASEIKYPAVLKARKGSGAHGVWYARDPSDLLDHYQRATLPHKSGDGIVRDSTQPMVQAYIPGELHDVTAFCIDGQMKLGMTQQRLVTKPLSGGMGIVNVTTKNEQLLHYARKIIDKVKWNGVALIDFKIDRRDGQPKLLEVNPRFWGTTWLTIKAGLNYPYYLVLHAYGLPIDYPEEYKVGLHCRWPITEFHTIFENPLNFSLIMSRFQDFLSRFKLKNCVYYIRP